MKFGKLCCLALCLSLMAGVAIYSVFPVSAGAEVIPQCGHITNPACPIWYTCEWEGGNCNNEYLVTKYMGEYKPPRRCSICRQPQWCSAYCPIL